MTREERILLNEFKANVNQLFQKFQHLEAENAVLNEKLAMQKQEMARLIQEKINLGRDLERLEMANRILSGKDGDQLARKKINSIVREIDKCIALLNR
jgi:predicted nuclease with TOPRIM domain